MVEYYPKNNSIPVIAVIAVGSALVLLNETARIVFGTNIPRYIMIPLALFGGVLLLLKINKEGDGT